MASGYEFEDDVINLLLPGYDRLEKDVKVPSGVGERKEVDVVAYKTIPPFGEIIFLIECKVPKIDKSLVEAFIEKIRAIRQGASNYANGIPIMIGQNGYTETAPDFAITAGVQLIDYDKIKDLEFPLPTSAAIMINRLDHDISVVIETDLLYTFDIYKDLKPLKCKMDYNIRGTGRFDLYAELENKKNLVFVIGKYVGKATENQLLLKIKKIEDYIKKQQTKKSVIYKFYGHCGIPFFPRSIRRTCRGSDPPLRYP